MVLRGKTEKSSIQRMVRSITQSLHFSLAARNCRCAVILVYPRSAAGRSGNGRKSNHLINETFVRSPSSHHRIPFCGEHHQFVCPFALDHAARRTLSDQTTERWRQFP